MPPDQDIRHAQQWANAQAPLIWLFGKTQAGKTSLVAEITGQGRDDIGRGFRPMTRQARIYAFPEAQPVLRFLDTRGLGDAADNETDAPLAEMEDFGQEAHVLMVVVRVDDLDLREFLAHLSALRQRQPHWPLIVVQSCLHHTYPRQGRHPDPYPFNGSDADFAIAFLPDALRQALMAQRALLRSLPGHTPPIFVPLDFTRPEQAQPPTDYGAERLWSVLEDILPQVAAQLAPNQELKLRHTLVLPWSLAAAAANAVPLPVIGGLGSASLQAIMVNQIARRRLRASAGLDHWGEFVSTLGAGFVLGFGGRWLAQQVLKMGVGWGSALVASWTFAVTYGLGEAAIYYFDRKAHGLEPERDAMIERYRVSLTAARSLYQQLRKRQP